MSHHDRVMITFFALALAACIAAMGWAQLAVRHRRLKRALHALRKDRDGLRRALWENRGVEDDDMGGAIDAALCSKRTNA